MQTYDDCKYDGIKRDEVVAAVEDERLLKQKWRFPFKPKKVDVWEPPRYFPFEEVMASEPPWIGEDRFFADTGFRFAGLEQATCEKIERDQVEFFVFDEQGRFHPVEMDEVREGESACGAMERAAGLEREGRGRTHDFTVLRARRNRRRFALVVLTGPRAAYAGLLEKEAARWEKVGQRMAEGGGRLEAGAVYVAASGIPSAGLGLFARFGFEVGDLITRYEGEMQTGEEVDELRGVYAVDVSRSKKALTLPENQPVFRKMARAKGDRAAVAALMKSEFLGNMNSLDQWDAPGRFANDACTARSKNGKKRRKKKNSAEYLKCAAEKTNAWLVESPSNENNKGYARVCKGRKCAYWMMAGEDAPELCERAAPCTYWLEATKRIAPDEEIFVQYGPEYWDHVDEEERETTAYLWGKAGERMPEGYSKVRAGSSPWDMGRPVDFLQVQLDAFEDGEKLPASNEFWETVFQLVRNRGLLEIVGNKGEIKTPLFKKIGPDLWRRMAPGAPRM